MKDLLIYSLFKDRLHHFEGVCDVPIIQKELVEKTGWATDEELMGLYGNRPVHAGPDRYHYGYLYRRKRKGIIGGVVATLGFTAPALVVIVIVAALLQNFSTIPQFRTHLPASASVSVF